MRLLVINNILPNHDKNGSCARMKTLLSIFRQCGHAVEYLARDTRGMGRYARALESLGIRVHGPDPARLAVWDDAAGPPLDMAALLAGDPFDAVIFVLWFWTSPAIPEQYMDEVRRLSPASRVVVLTDDIHWLHEARRGTLSGRPSFEERSLGLRVREREIYSRADFVAAITETDAARIVGEVEGAVPAGVLPHAFAMREAPPAPLVSRQDVVLAGSFGYFANVDGALWFTREVWPLVRNRLHGTTLRIIGANPPPEIVALGGNALGETSADGIAVTGWVPDIANELDRGRVFVSPIRYGTGLKTKNIEAMATGIPIVATTISIEGSGAIDGVTACVADDPAKFADAIVSLLTDDARWNAQSGAARSFVAGRYALAPAAALMEETLRRIMKTPPRATGEAAAGGEPWSVDRVLSKDDEILHAKTAPERFRARLSAHIALADAHLAAGRPEEALGELRIVLSHCQDETFEKEPVFASSLMRRIAQAHCVHGQTALAEACDEEASELDRRGMNRAGDRSHPPSVAIEGKRAFAYLCPALDGKGWIAPLSAYLDRHTAADDVSLILLGPAVQLQDEVVSWLARSGRDENLVADIVIVAAPGDPDDFPRYLAAANALLVEPEASASRPGGAAGQAAGTTGANEFERLAREQSVPVLRAGVDLLAAPRR